ncbi:TOMM system kinase/cyclase fusion protein [Hyalangium gracile]|uniref:TOMM system kinase/cyclase fusion protein n=1 Tax=Hyalangium gracile TaxID=394092 RepID=UPI001CCA39FB|nr:TOMM system kinase/cyclase fusion protein [Hyalangium gracile]
MDPIIPGTVFQGRYEVLSKLGEGGFGQVYRARQLVTQHEVAIKVLRALHTTNDTHIARFHREMQLCAQLYHPNIVRLIDSGKADPDVLYTVFEYVPGRTLTDVLAAEGALPTWDAAHLMLQVLDALACAHNKGVIHRDLKPQNIMVTTTGVRRNALVLDFGLGTLPTENQEELAKITQTREVLGTPTYAAPEQLRGDPVSARSDLYSWGLIFLECLTGQRAVDGATLQQVLFKQMGPEPVAIPAWLENHRLGRLLRKVTNKNLEQRDVSDESVMRELEACTSEGWPVNEAGPRSPAPAQFPVPDTLPSSLEGERRQLTAVCCSLRLFTGEAAMDEEDLDRLLRTLHSSCADVARTYDAHVGSILGEWMLFYFGYPRAQEDDARRAARAALEMSARMEQRATELAREHKGRLDFKAGIHTGLVISQEGRSGGYRGLPSLMGTTPNHAVRLESRAEPGSILVSEETSKLLRGHFALESVAASGGGAAQPTFRLLHEYKGPATPQPQEGRLYGRDQELDYLQQRWWQVTAGTGQSILLTGEPGIGKSRLVQELIRHARGTPHTVLESRCVPEGRNSALYPIVDLLERLLGVSRDWKPEQMISALEALLSQHGFELKEVMPLFLGLLSVKGGADRYPPLDVAPARVKELTLDALVGLFFEMAQQQPLLLLVEDLHWSDPTTLELLSHFVKEVSTARICLVLTARQEFTAPWATSHHLQLSRLDRKRIEEMVGGLIQNRSVPREVMDQLVNRTDGVPLFVEELTRIVAEVLPQRGETPSRSWTPSHIAIPTTLRDSLMSRLDRLGPAKELAQLASALGREFGYDVLKAISMREEPTLQQELKALVDADLVHRRRGVRNPTYVFKHALIRDTAYESMLRPVRRQVHAGIAATLEAHFPELVETRPDLLALHHSSAGQKRQAIAYAQKAGMAALMRSANQEAIAYITEALTWLDVAEDPRERAQLELGLNGVLTPALMATRGWSDARIGELVEHSQELIDLLGDSPQTIPTMWGLALFHLTRGNQLRAQPLAERLMAIARQAQSADLEMMARNLMGNSAYTQGRLQEAIGYFERTLSEYEPAKHQALASLYGQDARSWGEGFMGWLKCLTGYADQADAHSRRSVEWAQEMKHTSSMGLTYLYRLNVLQWRGERDKLIAEANAGEELLKRHGLPVHALYCLAFRGWATREAEPLRQGLAILQGGGLDLGMTYYKSMLAEVELEAGRPDVALQIVEELATWGRSVGELYALAELMRIKGLCLRARGEKDAAEAMLKEAIGIAREQHSRLLELRAASSLSELLRERGRAPEARELLAPLVKSFTEGFETADYVRAKALLGELTA